MMQRSMEEVSAMTRSWQVRLAVALVVGVVVLPASTGSAQVPGPTPEMLVGPWEGTAQTPNGEVTLKVNFTLKDGKLGGTIESSLGTIGILGASLADDKLTVGIDYDGSAGTLGGKVQASRIEGVWEVGGSTGTFVLARPGAGAAPASAVGDPISGAWAGDVLINSQTMPFSMVLRLNGDAVTGEMTSTTGSVPLANGAWKEGTLLLAFPYVGGEPVSMAAQLRDGKLSGVVDYNRGEATGTFTAVRK
jgi:hypothetical protein